MDETANVGDTAPAAPKEAGPGDAERGGPAPGSPIEQPVRETAPPPAVPEPAAQLVSAEQTGDPLRAEPVLEQNPLGPAAGATNSSAGPELTAPLLEPADVTEALEAPRADVSAAGEPDGEPRSADAPISEWSPAGPAPEAEAPPSAGEVVPPPFELEASPQEPRQAETGPESGEEEQLRQPVTPPAAAWAAAEPLLPAPAGEVAAPDAGDLERETRALERTAGEGVPSAPNPGAPAPEAVEVPPEAAEAPAALFAPEMRLTEPDPLWKAPSAPDDFAAARAAEAPVEPPPSSYRELSPPEVQQGQGTAGGFPDAPGQPAYAAPAARVAAWTPAVEAMRASPTPVPTPQPTPAWLPPLRPSADAATTAAAVRRALSYLRLAVRATGLAAVGVVATVLVLVMLYRWVNPPLSTLMIGRTLAGTEIERSWRPLERISPHLMRAVILSEDGGFCRHRGVDWAAMVEAIESDRGGSTITMQVVKNLFLWPSRSYVRKAIEIGLAYLVEALWSKRRILEIYLNIAEWGDGVFGAEAAAQTHFGKRAARLTAEEAALMAAVLPNPIDRTAGAPSLMTGRLASRLLVRMRNSRADLSCVPVPRTELRKAPQKSPQRTPEKAPLVQGPRMTL